MTPKYNPMTSRITRWLFALCLTAGTLFAQSTGTITGRVFDERTGQSLEGAVVRVVGSTAVDYTTSDGRYLLAVPAGEATIEVEYIGLDTLRQTVSVPAGGAA